MENILLKVELFLFDNFNSLMLKIELFFKLGHNS